MGTGDGINIQDVEQEFGLLRSKLSEDVQEEWVEKWLREEVVPAAQKLKINPASGICSRDLRAKLAGLDTIK